LLHEGLLGVIRQAVSLGPAGLRSLPYGVVAISAMALTFLIAHLSWAHFVKPLVSFSHRYKYGKP